MRGKDLKPRIRSKGSPEQRFWSKVTKTAACWNWTAGTYKDGYGQFAAKGKYYRAHRYAYQLVKGTIPDKCVINHLCENRLCVNPQHLQAVTQLENVAYSMSQSSYGSVDEHW